MKKQPYRNKNHLGPGITTLGGFILLLFVLIFNFGCSEKGVIQPTPNNEGPLDQKVEGIDYFLPHIELNNWKVTLPIGNPTEVEPPEILDYANNELLKTYMYNDSIDGSLVFHTYPGETTTNSSYSRTELREQMEPGSNNLNWTFEQGGTIKGRLKVQDISKDVSGKFHRTIIMQIHGRLTNEQRDLIGEDDNNAPPILKIYWDKGKIRVKTKELKEVNVNDVDILRTNSWTDDEGKNFNQVVDFEEFTLEVKVEKGKMQVSLNNSETFTYEGIHMDKWGVFENYFKAGNYLQTRDGGAFATVKYYNLEVSH